MRGIVTGNALFAERHEQFSVWAEFVNDMIIRIGRPNEAVAIEMKAVCLIE